MAQVDPLETERVGQLVARGSEARGADSPQTTNLHIAEVPDMDLTGQLSNLAGPLKELLGLGVHLLDYVCDRCDKRMSLLHRRKMAIGAFPGSTVRSVLGPDLVVRRALSRQRSAPFVLLELV